MTALLLLIKKGDPTNVVGTDAIFDRETELTVKEVIVGTVQKQRTKHDLL